LKENICKDCNAYQYNEEFGDMCTSPVCIKEYYYDPEIEIWIPIENVPKTNKSKVWVATFSYIDEFEFLGLFKTQFKAFLACMSNYKEESNKSLSCYRDKKWSNRQWHRNDIIKNLRRYQIFQEEVK